jgi:methyltransferase-like protein
VLLAQKKQKQSRYIRILLLASFYINNSSEVYLSASSPALKAVMYALVDNVGNPLSIDELINLASKKVPDVPKDQIEAELAQNAARLIFSGYFKIFAAKAGIQIYNFR